MVAGAEVVRREGAARVIAMRRVVAVALVLPLLVAFIATLIVWRVNATALQPGFYERQLDAVGAYQLVSDQVLPAAVHDFLANQQGKLPDNLRGVTVPTDPASEQAIVDLLRLALPPAAIRAETDGALDQLLPYLSGRTNHFDIRLHLGDELRAVASHPDGRPSALQRTWDGLGLGERTIRALTTQYVQDQGISPAAAAVANPSLGALLAGRADGASAWLETQLFGALDAMVPYLLGDAPHFHVVISFQQFPALAAPFATALHRTPDQLATEGFVLDDQQIDAELVKSNRSQLNDPGNALGLFRSTGYSITEQQLLGSKLVGHDSSAESGVAGSDGLDLAAMRTWSSRLRGGRWLLLAATVLLVTAIGLLGGRRWRSRLAWGAAALLIVAAISFVATGPVYTATLSSRLDTAITNARAKDAGDLQPVRDRLLDQVRVVIDDDVVGRMAATSRNWAALSVLALAASAGWALYDRRRVVEPEPVAAD